MPIIILVHPSNRWWHVLLLSRTLNILHSTRNLPTHNGSLLGGEITLQHIPHLFPNGTPVRPASHFDG